MRASWTLRELTEEVECQSHISAENFVIYREGKPLGEGTLGEQGVRKGAHLGVRMVYKPAVTPTMRTNDGDR